MGEIRKLALQGIPDGAGIRATVWKVWVLVIRLVFVRLRVMDDHDGACAPGINLAFYLHHKLTFISKEG